MHADKLKRTQRTSSTKKSLLIAEPESTPRDRFPPRDGWSLTRTLEEDIDRSMQAVGRVCRAAMIGVLLCGLGGVAALLGLLLF